MSIVALSKVTLYGPAAEKEAVLDGLQNLGCLHLNNLRPGTGEAADPEPSYPDARLPPVGPFEGGVLRVCGVFRHDLLRCGLWSAVGGHLGGYVEAPGAHRHWS